MWGVEPPPGAAPGCWGTGASPSGPGGEKGDGATGRVLGRPDRARLIKRDLGEGRPGRVAVAGGG